MDKKTIQFDVSSPEELRLALDSHAKNGKVFAGIRVLGTDVLTRQFNFPRSSKQDLVDGLKLEASETLSVGPEDTQVAYLITGTDKKGVYGIFSAMPRHLISDYMKCFDKHPLVPVSLTASAISAVADFLKDQPLAGDNFCLVNFLKDRAVNIIVFTNAKPTFFRELNDLSDSDLKAKITDTIRYACRDSAAKSINQIFFIGDLSGKEESIKSLKELENFTSQEPITKKGGPQVDLMSLNLLDKYVLKPAVRSKLLLFFSLVSLVFIAGGLLLARDYNAMNSKLQNARIHTNMGDYYRAINLQDQLRRMSHV